jgi:PEP-CTERM motif
MYDFSVDATSGVLSGDAASGMFSFDSGTIPSGGGTVGGTNLLTALSFRWDGITYDASTANTGWLTFNSTGQLTFFSFGDDCVALACTVNSPSTGWVVSPGAVGFVYSGGGPFGFGKVSYSLVTSVPEPATTALFGLALLLGILSMRIRDRLTSRSGSATAPERT